MQKNKKTRVPPRWAMHEVGAGVLTLWPGAQGNGLGEAGRLCPWCVHGGLINDLLL